jgi:sugar lactone lactonase YvrE
MTMLSRHETAVPSRTAEGWTIARLTPPSRLHGANGLTTGADGRIWVAQVPGSMVSAIDPDSGAIETISPMGGAIVAPDDLVFDEAGNLYLTEITEGRVAMRDAKGAVRVLLGDFPVANPITYHQGHLYAGQCQMDARIVEIDRNGGAVRTILEGVPMANAFQIGPDGKLYMPVMGANEIWRVDVATGAHEVVAGNLGVPDSVKFDSKGRIVTTQVATGDVLRIDPQSGRRETLANLGPGLDNVTFVGDRIFISSINGSVTEILAPGQTRALIQRGLQWPLGLGAAPDGTVFVCDGVYGYALGPDADGTIDHLTLAAMLFWPGSPGYLRGVTAGGQSGEWIVTTGLGAVARYRPAAGESEIIAQGYDRLMGVATTAGGAVVFAEMGTGVVHIADGAETRALGTGLDEPMGVVVLDEAVYVAEAGAGRVTHLGSGTVAENLGSPQGLCASQGKLYTVDTTGKRLIEIDPASGHCTVIASDLPVGAPAGITPKFLRSIGNMAGPMINFAGITAGPDGTLYVSGDAEGSVLALRRI